MSNTNDSQGEFEDMEGKQGETSWRQVRMNSQDCVHRLETKIHKDELLRKSVDRLLIKEWGHEKHLLSLKHDLDKLKEDINEHTRECNEFNRSIKASLEEVSERASRFKITETQALGTDMANFVLTD